MYGHPRLLQQHAARLAPKRKRLSRRMREAQRQLLLFRGDRYRIGPGRGGVVFIERVG